MHIRALAKIVAEEEIKDPVEGWENVLSISIILLQKDYIVVRFRNGQM